MMVKLRKGLFCAAGSPKYFIVLECVTGWKVAKDINTPL